MKVNPYHTDEDPQDRCYHVYSECPAGSQIIHKKQGTLGHLCKFCASKERTGRF